MDKARDKTRAARKALEEAEAAEKVERWAKREVVEAKRYKLKVTYTIQAHIWTDDPDEVKNVARSYASRLVDDAFEHPDKIELVEAPGTAAGDFILQSMDVDAGELWSPCSQATIVCEDPDTKVRSDSCPHYGGEYCNMCGAHVRPLK